MKDNFENTKIQLKKLQTIYLSHKYKNIIQISLQKFFCKEKSAEKFHRIYIQDILDKSIINLIGFFFHCGNMNNIKTESDNRKIDPNIDDTYMPSEHL